jgi:hypothetical protein
MSADRGETSSIPNSKQVPKDNLNGAAIIDKSGQEVPITESMIADAFNAIAKSDKP